MKTNKPSSGRPENVGQRRAQRGTTIQRNRSLDQNGFHTMMNELASTFQGIGTNSFQKNPKSRIQAILFDRGNNASMHFFTSDMRISIEIAETGLWKGGQS